MSSSPLGGTRVLDLGRGEAARLAATLLVDLGAERCGPMEGPGAILELLERCDVAIDDGALAEIGVDTGPIRAGNPGLVVLQIPLSSGVAAGAQAGVYAPPLARTPRFTPIPVATTLAGLHGALGVVAALIARERDGRGQRVSVSLVEAGFAAVETLLGLSDRAPAAWQGARWAASPFVGRYRCSDGRWVFVHFGLASHLELLLAVLREAGMIRQAAGLLGAISEPTRADPSAVHTVAEATAVRALLAELFEGRPAEAWEALLGGAGLCCAMARTGAEWRSSEQARLGGHVVDGALGPWICVEGGSEPPVVRKSPLRAPDDRPVLTGIRVLDLTQVIAGPVAGRALAELGAEVVRIEHPHTRPAWSEAFHVLFNPGKRSVTAALDPGASRELLEGFRPDLVLTSWRQGVDARLGLGPDSVRAVCPDAVVVRLNAWGQAGPWSGWPGWEQTVQAGCGLQVDYGGGLPELVPLPINDEATGLAAALGAAAALLHRARCGEGLDVHTSLAATATWLQRDWLLEPSGRIGRRERGPSLGAGPRRRFAPTSDGWLWIEGAIERIGGLEAVDPEDPDAVDRLLRKRRSATWLARAAGVPGVCLAPWRTLGQAVRSPEAPIERVLQPGLGRVTRVESPLHLERTPRVHAGPTPIRGSDGGAIPGVAALEPDAIRDRALGARVRTRLQWAAATARWGAWIALSRLAPVWLALLLGCGTGEQEPRVPSGQPFVSLGDSKVTGRAGSNAGLGLSASARPVRELWLDRDPSGALRVGWIAGELRSRTWDGSAWTDTRAPLSDVSGRIKAWQVGPGAQILGGDTVPLPELKVRQDDGERLWTGGIEGTWATDPQGRIVLAHFAGPRVVVRRWDGSQWSVLGEDFAPAGYRAGGRLGPTLAFDAASEPVVAWREPYELPPAKGGLDRYKTTRWRTVVRHWTGASWQGLAGAGSELDEDPSRYPQPSPGDARNLRAEWEAAQHGPPRVAVLVDGAVVVAWDTLGGIQIWRHRTGWEALPDPVKIPGDPQDVVLIAYAQGAALAWSHAWEAEGRSSPREIQVRILGADGWRPAGEGGPAGVSATQGPSIRPRLAVDGDGLAVAWVDVSSGAHEVLLARFDGSGWVGLPPGDVSGGLGSDGAGLPSLAGSEDGMLAAWVGSGEAVGDRVESALWTGADWTEIGPISSSDRIGQARLASGHGVDLLLWDERRAEGKRGLSVARRQGAAWVPLGEGDAARPGAPGIRQADLAVGAKGEPWIAWAQGGRPVQVQRWDGEAWQRAGTVPAASAAGYAPVLRTDPRGRPWLLWLGPSANREIDLKLAWFDGTDWKPVGDSWWLDCDPNIGGPTPAEATLALGPEGRPVVAWVSAPVARPGVGRRKTPAAGDAPALSVCRWTGTRWEDLPEPARGTGLRTPDARRSHLSLTASDGPAVAWSEADADGRQIHAARWDGDRWVGLGDRSGVVSDCDGACWSPAMALDAHRRCVAWEQMANRGRRVSLACQRAL